MHSILLKTAHQNVHTRKNPANEYSPLWLRNFLRGQFG